MQKAVTDKYSSANVIIKENKDQGALLIGDCNSAVDKQVIKPNKIQMIITLGQDAAPEIQNEEITYKLYNVLDNKSQKIGELLDEVYELIEEGRSKGGVLVHCYTGISRSPSFVIGYLMRTKFISFDEAKAYVKKYRNVAHPNDNFHRQLQNYWKTLQLRQEERLKKERELNSQAVLQIDQIEEPNKSQMFTNLSGVSKKTLRGVKGAVKSAHKSSSLSKDTQQHQEQSFQRKNDSKILQKIYEKQEEVVRKSRQKKDSQIKGVYTAKTKVI